jgi:hypothetical protein
VPIWHRAAAEAHTGAGASASPDWTLFRRLARGVACRAAFMGLGIGAVALGGSLLAASRGEGLGELAATHLISPAGFATSNAGPLFMAWCAWAVAGAAARYTEELLAALSAAPLAQALAAAGQGLRLLGLGSLTLGSPEWALAVGMAKPDGLAAWWAVEAAVALLAVLAAAAWAAQQARRGWGAGAPGVVSVPPPAAAAEPTPAEQRRIRRAFWAVQVLGLALGSAAMRLWAGLWSGPVAAGLLSVALTLLDSLRGLLPVTWLAPWLRTRLVRAHGAGAPVAALWSPVARLMAASAALWALAMGVLLGVVHGLVSLPAAGALGAASGGSALEPVVPLSVQAWTQALAAQLSQPVLWLGLLGLGLALQVLHACLGLVTVTVGLARPHLLATAAAAAVVLGAAAFAPWAGLWTWPLATLVAEGLWLSVVGWAVHRLAARRSLNPPVRRTRACGFT